MQWMHKLKFDIKKSYINAQKNLKPKLILEFKNAYIDLKISQHTKLWIQNLTYALNYVNTTSIGCIIGIKILIFLLQLRKKLVNKPNFEGNL
jgi:membrane-anchored glycerophosphoryl diester phosphodiesterase (GDPDase)